MPAYNAEKTLERTYARRAQGLRRRHHPRRRRARATGRSRSPAGSGSTSSSTQATAATAATRRPATGRPSRAAPTSSSWSIPTTSTTRPSFPTCCTALERPPATRSSAAACSGAGRSRAGCRSGSTSANILLTAIENATFLIYLTEYHSGFRAYTRRYLETVNLEANSDGFVFDTEIIAQGMARGLRDPRDPDRDPLLRRSLPDRLRSLGPLRLRDSEDDAPLQTARLGNLVGRTSFREKSAASS